MKEKNNRSFEELKVGDKAAIEQTITEQDVNPFAEVSCDYNPVHIDGVLAASLVSRVIETKLPGPGTVYFYFSQSLNFKAPVYFGDTILAEVEVIEKIDNKNFVKLKTVCSNQTGTVVVEGEVLVLFGK